MSIVRILAAAAVIVSLASTGVAPSSAASTDASKLRVALQHDLDGYLKTRSAKEHLSALSLSVSLGKGQPTINVTAGTTRYGAGAPATPTNLYQIGSNTKAFTAVAILQLEAQGRLSIDAPLGNYLPQYPAYSKLTLRRLLNMTSGLESYDNTPAWERSFAEDPSADVSADTLIRLVYPDIKYAPGSRYAYSNTGYLLAQEVVAARSRSKSYDAEIARIIASVGLKNTFYSSHLYAPAIARRVVAGYYENNDAGFGRFLGKDMSGYSVSWAQGAGAIVSTPADLIAWVRALYQGTALLPPKQKRELLSLVSIKSGKPLAAPTAADPAGFGLGVAKRIDPKLGSFWFYQGETLGFRAAHLYFPDSGLVVALFANSRPVESDSKLQQLFSTIYATIKANRRD
ncbi:MAG: serine hydrolase domain-containing protein [Vulcanimicrobiaceae bacterium]